MSTGSGRPLSDREVFRDRLDRVLSLDPDAPALEFGDEWSPWRAYSTTAAAVRDALVQLDLPAGTQIGVLLRNRPVSVGLLLGILHSGACLVVLNPLVGRERVVEDVVGLKLPMIAGEPADLADLFGEPSLFGDAAPPAVLELGELASEGLLRAASTVDRAEPRPDTAVRLLTSGTTGPPKRSDLTFSTLQRVLHGAKHYESSHDEEVRLHDGVVIVNSPLVHLGGVFRILQAVHDGRRMSLLERFTVDEWVDRVRRHKPKTASLVPTALRMVYDADVDPASVASLKSVVSGTAPLNPDLADAFTARYGIPVLTNYAATEFGGGVAGWNVADHRKYWTAKRGSVGRAHEGCALRVVDETSGDELGPDEVGLLEVRAAQVAADSWVRTTDLARIDEDGFLWILGRADQTILRGGLKVQPATVQRVMERHPAVRAVVVLGLPDERLGQVPVALVERASDVDPATLLEHAAGSLARYEVPVAVYFVDALPRTESGKVDLRAARGLAEAAAAA